MEFFEKLWAWSPEIVPVLLKAPIMTIQVTVGALALALALGIFVAVARTSPFKPLSYAALIYTDVMRGTPALVQLFIIFFGLSDIGLEFDPVTAAIVGLGMNGAAYVGEIYRAGIEAIHRGQLEAALSLGMTPVRAMRYIILPQAVRIVLPPIANYAVGLLKETALCSIIAAPELMLRAKDLASSSFLPMHAFVLAAVFYYFMSFPMMRAVDYLERKMGQGR